MEAATATLVGDQQLPTAPELPTTSNTDNDTGNTTSSQATERIDTDNIGWNHDRIDSTASELRQRATSYSFTGSALASGNMSELNESGGASGTTNENKNNNNSSNSTGNATASDKDKEHNEESLYECNICLDTAKDAVVSMCGHLFCWPCLHQWLLTRPNRKLCPVCKAAVDKDKVIPLYGRNSTRQEDPRNKVPPRPAGQRTEPEPAPGFPGFGFGDSFHMSFGIGAFPFGFFTSSLNFGEPRPAAANRGTTQYDDEQTLSRLFLYLAFLCIGWLLFA